MITTIVSFIFFTALVAFLTWLIGRGKDAKSNDGFFLAGRSLSFPFIASSLLLTNLSTEQLVGLNGDAYTAGLSVMVWEVIAVFALVAMAIFFLPKFLKSGITTVPEFLELRFGDTAQLICNIIFLLAYMFQLLPIILYTGAVGISGILDMKSLTGMQSNTQVIWFTIWLIGLIGSVYALFGGLRSIVISDLLNGIGLLSGGLMITWFGLRMVGEVGAGSAGIADGLRVLGAAVPEHLNSIGGKTAPAPFWNIFTGILLLNMFYWCTNQQIIQRTLAASSLKEGQKGVLLTALLKLIGPLYLVLPGIMAFYLYQRGVFGDAPMKSVDAYGTLVKKVLPGPLTGFFAAAMVGAVLSSFNSALNSTCTLFSLGVYRKFINKTADDEKVVRAGKRFGLVIALGAMTVAPLLAGTESIFSYLQKINGIYFIPIFAVVLSGLIVRRMPQKAAVLGLIGGVLLIMIGYFVLPRIPALDIVGAVGEYHFIGMAFLAVFAAMLVVTAVSPLPNPWVQEHSHAVEIIPWRGVWPCSIALIAIVIAIYAYFADFSVL